MSTSVNRTLWHFIMSFVLMVVGLIVSVTYLYLQILPDYSWQNNMQFAYITILLWFALGTVSHSGNNTVSEVKSMDPINIWLYLLLFPVTVPYIKYTRESGIWKNS